MPPTGRARCTAADGADAAAPEGGAPSPDAGPAAGTLGGTSSDGHTFDAGLADGLASAALGLARRFRAGATLWCVAPGAPAHARHVAVEFVHPVIMGKPALPAVAVDDPDPAGALRTMAAPGDVVLAVSRDPRVDDVVRRAPAWGVTTIWMGVGGPSPEAPAAADHALVLDDPDGTAAHDGRLMLLYHVLWELTHVCLEHQEVLTDPAAAGDGPDVCVTCSDEGRVAEVVAVGAGPDVTVRAGGAVERADASLAGGLAPGDLVLIHAGTVIAVTSR